MKRFLSTLFATGVVAIAFFAITPGKVEAASVTVQSGDDLYRMFGSRGYEVCHINGLANCDLIFPGQVLDDGLDGNTAPVPSAPIQSARPSVSGVPGLSVALATPYLYGGSSPYSGFDCSGLTQWLSAQRGMYIPRTSQEQAFAGRWESRGELLPGDLVIMNQKGHVGMYIGNNQLIHALNPSQGIQVQNLDFALQYNPLYSFRALGH